jgi:hypothetical protein
MARKNCARVLTELGRRRHHVDDGAEEVGVDDGGDAVAVPGPELAQGVLEQRVVVGGPPR